MRVRAREDRVWYLEPLGLLVNDLQMDAFTYE